MKKKFAFLLMGDHYDPEIHHAAFETARQTTCIFAVKDFDGAISKVKELREAGFGAIELCGAFDPEKAGQLAELTGNQIAIGYVIHDSGMDGAFARFFSGQE